MGFNKLCITFVLFCDEQFDQRRVNHRANGLGGQAMCVGVSASLMGYTAHKNSRPTYFILDDQLIKLIKRSDSRC